MNIRDKYSSEVLQRLVLKIIYESISYGLFWDYKLKILKRDLWIGKCIYFC